MCGFLWPALSQSAAVFFEASFGCFLDVSFLAWSRTCSSLVLYSDRWFVWLYLLFCCKGVWGVCACDLPVHISVHRYLNFFSICNTLSVVSLVFSSRSFSSSVVLFIYFFVIFLFLFSHIFFLNLVLFYPSSRWHSSLLLWCNLLRDDILPYNHDNSSDSVVDDDYDVMIM